MRADHPGGPIRWRMHFAAAPETVFDVLDSDDGRAAFWAESAKEGAGAIHFKFANGFEHRGAILERERPHRYVVEYFGGPVRFELSSDGAGGTDLLLTHEGIGLEHWNEVHAGWLNVLFPMKGWIDHGVDLRNHDAERTWDDGYADQ